MAHVISNAYIKSPTARNHDGFSAGSYKDLTRVAWLNPAMWAELFLENRENLLFELDTLIRSLEQYREAIQEDDFAALCQLLEGGPENQGGGGRDMTTVTVRASRPYEVTIGRGLLDTVGRQAAGQWKGRSAGCRL